MTPGRVQAADGGPAPQPLSDPRRPVRAAAGGDRGPHTLAGTAAAAAAAEQSGRPGWGDSSQHYVAGSSLGTWIVTYMQMPVLVFSAGPKLLRSLNVSQVVQKECTEIMKVFLMTGCCCRQPPNDLIRWPCSVQSFQKVFGEKLLESIEAEEWKPPTLERKDTCDSPSVLMEARGNL